MFKVRDVRECHELYTIKPKLMNIKYSMRAALPTLNPPVPTNPNLSNN